MVLHTILQRERVLPRTRRTRTKPVPLFAVVCLSLSLSVFLTATSAIAPGARIKTHSGHNLRNNNNDNRARVLAPNMNMHALFTLLTLAILAKFCERVRVHALFAFMVGPFRSGVRPSQHGHTKYVRCRCQNTPVTREYALGNYALCMLSGPMWQW